MKVKVVQNFKELQETWKINYPKLNEILKVKSVKNYDGVANLPTLMLKFERYDYLPWMCLCDYKGDNNFEILINISESIEQELNQLNNKG
jgi:hypothetical protein